MPMFLRSDLWQLILFVEFVLNKQHLRYIPMRLNILLWLFFGFKVEMGFEKYRWHIIKNYFHFHRLPYFNLTYPSP